MTKFGKVAYFCRTLVIVSTSVKNLSLLQSPVVVFKTTFQIIFTRVNVESDFYEVVLPLYNLESWNTFQWICHKGFAITIQDFSFIYFSRFSDTRVILSIYLKNMRTHNKSILEVLMFFWGDRMKKDMNCFVQHTPRYSK